jgi:hypothetical protein
MKTAFLLFALNLITINPGFSRPELNSLVGKYAHYDVVSYVGELFGPFKLKSRIISFGITEYYLDGQKLMTRDRFCFSDYRANFPFKSKTSDEFTRAITPKEVELEVMETNGEVLVHRPETPTLIGVDLTDYRMSFPPDSRDPRFTDDDKDGKPGITVNLTMGSFFSEELYIARKEIFSYDLKKMGNGILKGVVRDRSQQYIIGATKPELIKSQNPIQNMNLSKSPIYLIPLQENLSCDGLKVNRDLYFPTRDKGHKKFYKDYKYPVKTSL